MDDLMRTAQRVQFGVFEVDLRAGELWKAGRKRKLTGQPFAILAILLERPGEVVSREEFQKRLWPDTFVDVDHNLNTAINKIREALDDSSERPRFVETLPRRGYRFIAPVAPVESAQPPTPPIPALTASDIGSAQTAASPSPRKKIPVWLWPIIAAIVLVLAWFLRPDLPPPQVTGTTQLTRDNTIKLELPDPRAPLFTDGSRIYFAEGIGSLRRLMQVSTDGGEARPVEMPFPFDGLGDISPSGTELLISGPPLMSTDAGDDGLWLLPVSGGQARRVGDLMASDSTFTPDGTAIYYNTGPYIFKANPDGSQPRKILTMTAERVPFWLRFSPDGRLLRFSVVDLKSTATSLWEVHADGSHLTRLYAHWNNSTDECCGNWTSDGKYFLFQAARDGVTNLWAQRVKGDWWRKVSHAPVQLTLGQMNSASPLPSKDGTKVFFVGTTRRDELVRYEPETRSFTPFLPGLSAEGLSFTKDGKRVAYVSFPDGNLWQSRTDGGDRHELSFPPTQAALPNWSPDGTQIEFMAREPGGTWQIFVVPAEGGAPRQLTSGPLGHADGSWSPDGNSMAFGGTFDEARSTISAIQILDMKTRKVTDVPGSAGLFSPRWSPDGRYLLALTGKYLKLMLYSFADHKWEVLTNIIVTYPNWSQDGKCVYFNAPTVKTLPMYRVCLDDRVPQHIVDLSHTGQLAGTLGQWTGLGPNDSILAARDTGIEELYALDTKFPN